MIYLLFFICSEQSFGQSPYRQNVSINHAIYLRPGLSQIAPNVPFHANTVIQSVQSQNLSQSTRSSVPENTACIQICMPSCEPQCIRQEQIASLVNKGPISVTDEQIAPVISQRPAPMIPQDPVTVMPSQGVVGSPDFIIPDKYKLVTSHENELNKPMLPQGTNTMTPSGGVQGLPWFSGVVSQVQECVPACVSACSIQCTQQNLVRSQAIESPVYSTLAATNVPMPGSGISTPQQPTNECVAACTRLCNAECTHDRPQPRTFAPEHVPAQLSPTPVPDQFGSLVPLQPSTTECLPSISETECACPSGFSVCVTASGSNQCCRIR